MAVAPIESAARQYTSTNKTTNGRPLLLIFSMVMSCYHCSEDFYDMFTNYEYSPFVCIYILYVLELGKQVKDEKCNEPQLYFTVYKNF